jgi:protein phosphatase 2C family protein 2/3
MEPSDHTNDGNPESNTKPLENEASSVNIETVDNNNQNAGKGQTIDFGDDDDNAGKNKEGGGGRSHTFRERRLTYTKASFAAFDPSELEGLDVSDDDDAAGKKGNNEKMLSDTDNTPNTTDATDATTDTTMQDSPEKDEAKAPVIKSPIQLEARVLHASAPPVPNDCPKRKRNLLYIHQRQKEESEAENEKLLGSASSPQSQSPTAEWKKRRTSPKDEDDSLPFPRDIVGTYSCHGIEPVYDETDSNSSAPSCIAKINQDRGGVAFPYANNSRMALFAAYDGHGDGGEHVSQFALHEIPRRLEQHEDFLKGDFEKALKEVFVSVDKDLTVENDIEPLYSGCTACVALLKDKMLHLSNAGDSRAVMACQSNINGKTVYKALDLTVDQNPDSPGEQERIEQMGGFVSPPPEPGLSARVWLDCNYSQIGLAMSRSLGDHAVKSIGVIATPVVTKHELSENDAFMIIATDGVWEFLSSQQAVDMVSKDLESGKGSSAACQNLIEAAASMWHENEGDYRDDITALIIKVKELWED